MIIKPVADNIIIKVEKEDGPQKTASGIIIPKSNNVMKPDKGLVVALGAGRILNNGQVLKPTVKENDVIIFNRFAGTEVEVGEEIYLIIKEADVLAIIKE